MTTNEETAMAEDTLVRMLLEVAGGEVADQRDVALARAAARWAIKQGGWQLHLDNSFFFEVETLSFWILAIRPEQLLEIRTRLAPGKGWLSHARHRIAHLGQGLDVLATEGMIPAEFSTLGYRALESYAEAMDRAAGEFGRRAQQATPQELAEYGEYYPQEMLIRSATMSRAAEQARAFPRGRLAVLT
jgi:hypothetical protein